MRGVARAADYLVAGYGPAHAGPRGPARLLDSRQVADPFERAGIELINETAFSDPAAPSDGAVTAALLAAPMLQGAYRALLAGIRPRDLALGIRTATDGTLAILGRNARKLKSRDWLRFIATGTAGYDDELGTSIADLIGGGIDPATITIEAGPPGIVRLAGRTIIVGASHDASAPVRIAQARAALQFLALGRTGGVASQDAADAVALALAARLGTDILRTALQSPAAALARQLGLPAPIRRRAGSGLDVLTGRVVNMFEAAIVDSLPVVQSAVTRASDATLFYLDRAEQSRAPQFKSSGPSPENHTDLDANPSSPPPDSPPLGPPAAGPAPAEPPDRFLVANLPPRAKERYTVDLVVRVATDPAQDPADKLKMLVPPEGANLTIMVSATQLEIQGASAAKLYVPAKGDSHPVTFTLLALAPDPDAGPAEVYVTALHRGVPVAALTLPIVIDPELAAPPAETRAKLRQKPVPTGCATLFVSFHKPTDTYAMLWNDEEGPQEPSFTDKVFAELKAEIAGTISTINEIARLDYSYEADVARGKLESCGSKLWELLPGPVRALIEQRWDGLSYLAIYSTGDPFPWEMLYVFAKGSFLIEKMSIRRWCYGRLPPEALDLASAHLLTADFQQLKQAGPEAAAIEAAITRWNAQLRPTPVLTYADLFKLFKSGALDLLHVACHQSFETGNVRIMIGNTPLGPDDLQNVRFNALPLVFLNACQSDRKVPGYNQIGGWARAFLNAGVGAFIATHWEVRDQSAQLFATTFYDTLLAPGGTVGAALAAARTSVKKKTPGDPTWLAYTFYGDADAAIQPVRHPSIQAEETSP